MAHETSPAHDTRPSAVLHRWPTLVGLLAAASQILTGADRTTVGIVVAVATICYLAAAALGRPWAAWAAIPVVSLIITGGAVAGVAPMTTLGATAAVLVVTGLVLGVSRRALGAQTAAALAYGGLVVAGLAMAPDVGLVLVGVTLMAHAGWDIVHIRRRIVVPGSLAEFCIALDLTLGAAVLIGLTG